MPRIFFTDNDIHPDQLFPFILTRPAHGMRVGILTIQEKWERALDGHLPAPGSDESQSGDEPPLTRNDSVPILQICGNLLPTAELLTSIKALKRGEYLQGTDGARLAAYPPEGAPVGVHDAGRRPVRFAGSLKRILYPWHICEQNAWAIGQDWETLSKKGDTHSISPTNAVSNAAKIYLEPGVSMEFCNLNATEGPIYIGKNALVMEGTLIRGPVAIGEGAVVKMGTKLYGGTTIGPYCTAGGEIKNSVLFGFSNKAHDGYLGDSVIGEWCNLGAGTTNSNVTNNASEVSVYTPSGFVPAGIKCGVMMGDYSRTAINTSINTGTVIGVCCNVHGSGLTPKFIPSFSWGQQGVVKYEWEKAIEHIGNWKRLKHKSLDECETQMLRSIFEGREG